MQLTIGYRHKDYEKNDIESSFAKSKQKMKQYVSHSFTAYILLCDKLDTVQLFSFIISRNGY